jgi:hypothetical protein
MPKKMSDAEMREFYGMVGDRIVRDNFDAVVNELERQKVDQVCVEMNGGKNWKVSKVGFLGSSGDEASVADVTIPWKNHTIHHELQVLVASPSEMNLIGATGELAVAALIDSGHFLSGPVRPEGCKVSIHVKEQKINFSVGLETF